MRTRRKTCYRLWHNEHTTIEVGSSSDTRGQSDKQSAITTTRMEEVPEASSFSLSLSNEKAEVKHWDSYADFKEGEKIAIGNYTLKAY